MNGNRLANALAVAIFATLSAIAVPSSAQVDLSGQWQALNHHDAPLVGDPGPDPVDYTGLPLTAEGRAAALAFNYSMISMTERMCSYWSPNYIAFAPHNIQIERIDDPVTGHVAVWKISAGGSDRAPIPIYMDGRLTAGPLDLHTASGFTTGEWQGDVLTARMTHIKRGVTRRNGAPLSDQATVTLHLVRRGPFLEILTVTEDPIYLEQPLVMSVTYQLNVTGLTAATNPTCFPGSEVPSMDTPGSVPHWLPGQNPFIQELTKRTNLPLEAVLGGAETMYPEFRKKLEGKYTPPATCTSHCRAER